MIDTIPRTLDDEIATARAELEAMDQEGAEVAAALPALRSDATRLAAIERAHEGSTDALRISLRAEEPTSGRPWGEVRAERERLEYRAVELGHARDRAATFLEQLQARRIPDVDDAIAIAKSNLAAIEDRSSRNGSAIRERRALRQSLDVDARLGDAPARRRLVDVDAELEDLERTRTVLLSDRDRVAGALEGLIERRAVREREIRAARLEQLAGEWTTHQAAAHAAALTVAEEVAALERIRAEWPNVLSLASIDWMWDPAELDRRLVDWARRLAFRGA